LSPLGSIKINFTTRKKGVPPQYLNEAIPLATAKDIDVFIDDGIVEVHDIGDDKIRAIQAMLLAIHILFRPADPQEKNTREDCLSLGKIRE
jgi:hypothetical protein